MKLEQLVYTPTHIETSNEHPNTFVLIVDGEAYAEHQRDSASVPVVNVVDSFDIFKYDAPGRSGKLAHPSKREIADAFGTTKADECVQFMLDNGSLSKHM